MRLGAYLGKNKTEGLIHFSPRTPCWVIWAESSTHLDLCIQSNGKLAKQDGALALNHQNRPLLRFQV